MKNNLNIEEVVKNAFENFEADVNPAAWTNIENGLKHKGNTVEKGGNNNAMKWTAAAAIIAMALLGTWYFSKETPEQVIDKKELPVTVSADEKVVYNAPVVEEKKAPEPVAVKEKAVKQSEKKEIVAKNEPKQPEIEKMDPKTANLIDEKKNNIENPNNKVNPLTEVKVVEIKTSVKAEEKVKNDPVDWSDFNQELTAVIEASPIEGPSPLTVSFFNINFGKAKTHIWNFGDGTIDSSNYKLTHTYNEPNSYRVSLTVKSENGRTFTTSTIINVDKTSKLDWDKVAKVFTPDNDGVNDRFCIEGESIKSMNVAIVDVNEQILYSWDKPGECWDGRKYNGELLPAGTYYWICNATGADGKLYAKKELIRIIR